MSMIDNEQLAKSELTEKFLAESDAYIQWLNDEALRSRRLSRMYFWLAITMLSTSVAVWASLIAKWLKLL